MAERRCICCGEVTDPDKLEVRGDPDTPGTWRVVEVRGAAAPVVRTHRRGICCQAHAEMQRSCLVLAAPPDAVRALIARARCAEEKRVGA